MREDQVHSFPTQTVRFDHGSVEIPGDGIGAVIVRQGLADHSFFLKNFKISLVCDQDHIRTLEIFIFK